VRVVERDRERLVVEDSGWLGPVILGSTPVAIALIATADGDLTLRALGIVVVTVGLGAMAHVFGVASRTEFRRPDDRVEIRRRHAIPRWPLLHPADERRLSSVTEAFVDGDDTYRVSLRITEPSGEQRVWPLSGTLSSDHRRQRAIAEEINGWLAAETSASFDPTER
jgi:hypothetical protein